MSEKNDLEDLAKRYLELWQDQMAAMAQTPETAAALQQFAASAGAAQEVWASALGGPVASRSTKEGETADGTKAPAAGPASSGPASVADGAGLELVLKRLDLIEERIGRLERALPGKSSRAGKSTPRKRS